MALSPPAALREPGFARKLTLAFGAVILVVAMTIPVALMAFNTISSSAGKAERAGRTLDGVTTLQRSIGNMRVIARDYAERKPGADARFANELNRFNEGARAIGAGDDGSAMPGAERARWRELAANASDARAVLQRALADGKAPAGIARFDSIMERDVQVPANRLAQQVRDRRTEAQQKIGTQIRASGALLLVVLAAALLVAVVLAARIPRSLTRRLTVLRHTAHRLASGDLTARIDDDAADDEMAELIHDFNVMARSLQQRQEENRMLQVQLQQSLLGEQERATRDPLTNLRNHRYFQESLRAEIDRCSRSGGQVTIAMIDLDNFKQVNDRFGHHEGDAVLLRVTKGITDNLRPYDLACRLGGEEFGVIFPETSAEEAQAVLARIAEHVVGFGPNGERATFSGGIATYPLHAREQAQLFQHADEAAYAAKGNGKAQTVVYDPRKVAAMDSEEHLARKSREAVLTTAQTLVSAVDQKDPFTRHHSELTAIYAATLARSLGLDEETVKLVYRAGLLHDVGKIGVGEHILLKAGRLTPEEYDQVKQHPEFSFRILESADMEPVATWVRHHHEHWDGSGYPFGLAGEDIPLGSRIVLVGDALDAMTSDRVYRRALTTQQAVDELLANAGTQFDPQLAATMVQLVGTGIFDQVREQYGKTPLSDTLASGTGAAAQAATANAVTQPGAPQLEIAPDAAAPPASAPPQWPTNADGPAGGHQAA